MNKLGPLASEKALSDAKKHEKLMDLQARDDLEWLLKQPQFRRWAINLLYADMFCGVNKQIWQQNSMIHFLEGRRSVGIDVLKTFTNFPELYSQFEHERVEAELDSLKRARIHRETEST